jgi:hypothetical protein
MADLFGIRGGLVSTLAVGAALVVGACTDTNFTGGTTTQIDAGGVDGISGGDGVAGVDTGPTLDPGGVDVGHKPDVYVPQPGEFGYACDQNTQCYSGYCVDSPEGKVCTKTCSDSCPDAWSCNQVVNAGGDPVFICTSDDGNLCRPCQGDDDCNTPGLPATGVCVGEGGLTGGFCTRPCTAALPCSNGFTCASVQPYGPEGATVELCVPDAEGTCTCTPKFVAENASSNCSVESETGTCRGTVTCTAVGPIPACNAPPPGPELCNGVDDDCDGEVDNDAQGCVSYYNDIDGDTYGQGNGKCLCAKPSDGANWIERGGDCNELVTNINPGQVETCNGFDDDCDGETDEEGADKCTTHWLDSDGDGWGLAEVTACLCEGTDGWADKAGDCNDHNPDISGGATEQCNSIDDDCDGVLDEAEALGCKPFFLDTDGDGFGLADKVKCLCGPTGVYLAAKPGDCDDSTNTISPNAPEVCNGVDDNCNSETDEGDPGSMCPSVAQGTANCVGGTCALISCEPGWSNADGDPLNGCECAAGALEVTPNNFCADAASLGSFTDEPASAYEVTDNIVSSGGTADEDWYTFTAVDAADPNGCDTFRLRVKFIHNPSEQFAFDVRKGSCAAGDEICNQSAEFTDTTNMLVTTNGALLGECPCVNSNDDYDTATGLQRCTDQTDTYFIRVYRKPGLPESCAAYTLSITNGPQ